MSSRAGDLKRGLRGLQEHVGGDLQVTPLDDPVTRGDFDGLVNDVLAIKESEDFLEHIRRLQSSCEAALVILTREASSAISN